MSCFRKYLFFPLIKTFPSEENYNEQRGKDPHTILVSTKVDLDFVDAPHAVYEMSKNKYTPKLFYFFSLYHRIECTYEQKNYVRRIGPTPATLAITDDINRYKPKLNVINDTIKDLRRKSTTTLLELGTIITTISSVVGTDEGKTLQGIINRARTRIDPNIFIDPFLRALEIMQYFYESRIKKLEEDLEFFGISKIFITIKINDIHFAGNSFSPSIYNITKNTFTDNQFKQFTEIFNHIYYSTKPKLDFPITTLDILDEKLKTKISYCYNKIRNYYIQEETDLNKFFLTVLTFFFFNRDVATDYIDKTSKELYEECERFIKLIETMYKDVEVKPEIIFINPTDYETDIELETYITDAITLTESNDFLYLEKIKYDIRDFIKFLFIYQVSASQVPLNFTYLTFVQSISGLGMSLVLDNYFLKQPYILLNVNNFFGTKNFKFGGVKHKDIDFIGELNLRYEFVDVEINQNELTTSILYENYPTKKLPLKFKNEYLREAFDFYSESFEKFIEELKKLSPNSESNQIIGEKNEIYKIYDELGFAQILLYFVEIEIVAKAFAEITIIDTEVDRLPEGVTLYLGKQLINTKKGKSEIVNHYNKYEFDIYEIICSVLYFYKSSKPLNERRGSDDSFENGIGYASLNDNMKNLIYGYLYVKINS